MGERGEPEKSFCYIHIGACIKNDTTFGFVRVAVCVKIIYKTLKYEAKLILF